MTFCFEEGAPSVLDFSGFTPDDSLEQPVFPHAEEFSGFVVVPPTPPLLSLRRQLQGGGEVSELRGMDTQGSPEVRSTGELQLSEEPMSVTDPYLLPMTAIDLASDVEYPEPVAEVIELEDLESTSMGFKLGDLCCCV
jgi:hypothetical protein